MRQKILFSALATVLVIMGGFAVWKINTPKTETSTGISTSTQIEWKTYTDSDTGFTFKYPAQYAVEASPVPTSEWGSRALLTLDDNPGSTSTKARAVPMTVGLQKQPVTASGKIYHTVAEYQQSGTAAKMIQGVTNPDGELVTVNGTQALFYYLPPGDMTGIAADDYFFIKDDLIYEVGISPSDPYKNEILQSIGWTK